LGEIFHAEPGGGTSKQEERYFKSGEGYFKTGKTSKKTRVSSF
jgi:hypothetical protein